MPSLSELVTKAFRDAGLLRKRVTDVFRAGGFLTETAGAQATTDDGYGVDEYGTDEFGDPTTGYGTGEYGAGGYGEDDT